ELAMIQSRPDWRQGLFCSLTRPQGSSRDRLLDGHAAWTSAIEELDRHPISQYRVVDYHKSGDTHLHALVYGVSGTVATDLNRMWCIINRIPMRARASSARIEPIKNVGALFYCAVKAVIYGERDFMGPWGRLSTLSGPVPTESAAEIVNRELTSL